MGTYILDTWILLIFCALWIILKLFGLRLSLYVAIAAGLVFAFLFLISVAREDVDGCALLYCLLAAAFIIAGGKKVGFKTQTIAFDEITGKPIGKVMKTGNHFSDPIFERVTVSVDGVANMAGDTQEFEIVINETPEMQTKTRGVQAKLKKISFMLHLDTENVESLILDIEGGANTVKERVYKETLELLHHKIGVIEAVDLDVDKHKALTKLAAELKEEINKFCQENGYPYQIPEESSFLISDTMLSKWYYDLLAKQVAASLQADADDATAERLRKRLIATGKELLPDGSAADQLAAAQISIGIVKKDVKETKISIDADTQQLTKDIASILKGK